MKRKFEPYAPVISRFCGSSRHIGDQRDYESSPSRSAAPSPPTAEAASIAPLAQVNPISLPLLDKKLAEYQEFTTRSKSSLPQTAVENPAAANKSVLLVAHKMAPKAAAEMPIEDPAPTSYQHLITMFAALPEAEQRLFAASNPMASIIKGKARVAEEKLRMEKETTAYLLTKITKLQTLLTEAKEVNANKSRDFGMFTKIELRNLMTSNGPAKEIIEELVARGVSEKALERSRGLNDEDMYKLFCEHPDVGEQFGKQCKESLVAYKLLCKDSYMQALREVEKDNKAWLGFQKEDLFKAAGVVMDVDGLYDKVAPSPAVTALQNPVMWATPDVPRDPAQAIESTRHAAEKARASLTSAVKGKLNRDMDRDSVEGRVMRRMGEKYTGEKY